MSDSNNAQGYPDDGFGDIEVDGQIYAQQEQEREQEQAPSDNTEAPKVEAVTATPPVSKQEEPSGTPDQASPAAPAKPLFKIKVDGQELAVNSYDDAVTLMQKGVDYTKKTQRLSEYSKVLQALDAHGDIKAELLNRLRGGTPQSFGAKAPQEAEPVVEAPKPKLPPQRDDETYEDWMQRIVSDEIPRLVAQQAEKVANASATKMTQMAMEDEAERRRRGQLLAAAKADPYFDKVIGKIKQAIGAKAFPKHVFEAADSDPAAFAWLFDQMKSQVLLEDRLSEGQATAARAASDAQAAAQAVPAAPATQKPTAARTRRPAPHVESASGRSGQPATRTDAEIIEDMSSDQLFDLLRRVQAGQVR